MTRAINWTQEGREVGVTLDTCHAVVVVGTDPVATSEVALGIARVQAQHRRVAIADMFGDAPPLQALVPTDDPHGLVDSFLYGVSINRIAYQVPDAGELFVMPSGTGPLDYEELFVNPRWRKLAAGFGEMGALLLIAAPAEAPQINALVDVTDGAVLVGDTVPADLPVAVALAWLREKRNAPMAVAIPLPPAQSIPTGVEEPAPPPAWRRYLVPAAAGVVLAAAVAAAGLWYASRPETLPPAVAARPAPAPVAAPPVIAPPVDSAPADSVRRDSVPRAIAADSFAVLAVTNPYDSVTASAYAVFLGETSTKAGAIFSLEKQFKSVPVATYGVKPVSNFLLLYAGAYPTRAGADSLLAGLRARQVLGPTSGSVMAVPYAFLVQSDMPAKEAAARVARFRASGLPVYALRQKNGAAHLYFGAYPTPQQAALAIPALRDARLTPTLVYRIGSVF